MAQILKRDTRRGTSLTFDRTSFARSRAVRSFFVEVDNGTRDDLEDAIGLCQIDASIDTHPDLGIRAQQYHATHHSDGKVHVTVTYNSRSANPNTGFTNVNARMGYISEPVLYIVENANLDDAAGFNAVGNPQGDQIVQELPDGGGLLISGTRTVPVWHLTVATVLTFAPYAAIGEYSYERLNDAAITWDGFSIAEHEARFDGANVDYRGDEFYYTTYHFTIRNGPWVINRYTMDPTTGAITPKPDWQHPARSFTSPGFIVAAA